MIYYNTQNMSGLSSAALGCGGYSNALSRGLEYNYSHSVDWLNSTTFLINSKAKQSISQIK